MFIHLPPFDLALQMVVCSYLSLEGEDELFSSSSSSLSSPRLSSYRPSRNQNSSSVRLMLTRPVFPPISSGVRGRLFVTRLSISRHMDCRSSSFCTIPVAGGSNLRSSFSNCRCRHSYPTVPPPPPERARDDGGPRDADEAAR